MSLIECRSCDIEQCDGCNIKRLSEMLHNGRFNSIIVNHAVQDVHVIPERAIVFCGECWKRKRLQGRSGETVYYCSDNIGLKGLVEDRDFCPYGERKHK